MKDENVTSPLAVPAEVVPAALKKKSHKPIVFAKRDKKAAISLTTHGLVQEGSDPISGPVPELPASGSTIILQEDLERWFLRWMHFREMDDYIVSSLARGATIEEGIHTAKLVPSRDETGRTYLKVFVQ